jgi:transcriptional regulator with XRE-family HTH domain
MDFDRIEALRIGQELKKLRKQKGLSLADVEHLSQGAWKAVVVGSYERADRAITIGRLGALMKLYGAPISALFPSEKTPNSHSRREITLDLSRRTELERDFPQLGLFVSFLINKRGDWNGHVLSLRSTDLELIAVTERLTFAELIKRLELAKLLLQWR